MFPSTVFVARSSSVSIKQRISYKLLRSPLDPNGKRKSNMATEHQKVTLTPHSQLTFDLCWTPAQCVRDGGRGRTVLVVPAGGGGPPQPAALQSGDGARHQLRQEVPGAVRHRLVQDLPGEAARFFREMHGKCIVVCERLWSGEEKGRTCFTVIQSFSNS